MKGEKKETYTYATLPSVKEKASRRAHREGKTLSEVIDLMLKEYVKPIKRTKYVSVKEANEWIKNNING